MRNLCHFNCHHSIINLQTQGLNSHTRVACAVQPCHITSSHAYMSLHYHGSNVAFPVTLIQTSIIMASQDLLPANRCLRHPQFSSSDMLSWSRGFIVTWCPFLEKCFHRSATTSLMPKKGLLFPVSQNTFECLCVSPCTLRLIKVSSQLVFVGIPHLMLPSLRFRSVCFERAEQRAIQVHQKRAREKEASVNCELGYERKNKLLSITLRYVCFMGIWKWVKEGIFVAISNFWNIFGTCTITWKYSFVNFNDKC